VAEVAGASAKSSFSGVNIIALIVVVAEIVVIDLMFRGPPSVNFCLGLISFVALSFIMFLFGVARKWGQRNIFVALAFVLSNLALLVIAFGGIYSQLGLNDTVSKKHNYTSIWDGIYFSIITLTTVGYGDITPTLLTRSIAAFEALTGYVIMGLLISVLVITAQRGRDR
jgi:hypothetical protein